MCASRNGHLEVVRLLLQAGAGRNLVDPRGKTALVYAEENLSG